jgi:tRNA 2-selenouridine synthase
MAITLTSLSDIAALGFDDIIDVRSPSEYAEDHVPGAISLPVLDDDERARVGTIYKQDSPFTARKIGGALVARNAARHLEGPLAGHGGGWKPLVYCWRGGQRSGSFATILSSVGWRAEVLAGGYKTYRSLVVKELYDTPVRSPVIVLDGNTGSAKTEVLAELARAGHQVIDLEGLANHRGSLFGNLGPQPAQKGFETALAMALVGLDPARPVVVEAESSKVGECRLPSRLWAAMAAAPRVVLEVPRAARADYLVRAYADLVADPGRTRGVVELLRAAHSHERIEEWLGMVERADWPALADDLILHHYDPRYAKHRARMGGRQVMVAVDALDPEGVQAAAGAVAGAIAGLTG